MKRTMAVVAAAFIMVLGVITPAHALQSTPAGCAGKSGFGYDVRVCATYSWRLQNDGTGVHLEAVNLYVTKGCGDLENLAFDSVRTIVTDTNEHRDIGNQYSCNVGWDLELNGSDKGGTTAITHANVNVNGGGADFTVDLVCDIHPRGSDYCYGQAY